jgi:hypothetical protein
VQLLADAECREDPTEQVIGCDRTGNFAEGSVTRTQLFGDQFERTRNAKFTCHREGGSGASERFDVPRTGGERSLVRVVAELVVNA